MKKIKFYLLYILLVPGLPKQVQASDFGVDNKLGGYIQNNAAYTGLNGDTIHLTDTINKITIISMVKYDCDMYCPKLLKGLAKLIQDLEKFEHIDYQVITLVYDFDISVEKTESVKKSFEHQMATVGVNMDEKWIFLASDMKNIHKLTKTLGYNFYEKDKQYIHFSLLTVVDPKGKIVNYMYGYRFLPFDFEITCEMALKGETRNTVPRNLKYCNNYIAPAHAQLHKIAVTGGLIIIFAALSLFLVLVYKKKST